MPLRPASFEHPIRSLLAARGGLVNECSDDRSARYRNPKRRHSTIGYLGPVEFETLQTFSFAALTVAHGRTTELTSRYRAGCAPGLPKHNQTK
jgi:hypothetical protein